MNPKLKIVKINPNAKLPKQATKYSAGYDLFSPLTFEIKSNEKYVLATGIKLKLPDKTYGRIAPRSGLAL